MRTPARHIGTARARLTPGCSSWIRCAATMPSSVLVGGVDVDDRAVGLLRCDCTHQAVDVSGLRDYLHLRRGEHTGDSLLGEHHVIGDDDAHATSLALGPVPATATGPGLAQMRRCRSRPTVDHRERRQPRRREGGAKCASSSVSQRACWRQRCCCRRRPVPGPCKSRRAGRTNRRPGTWASSRAPGNRPPWPEQGSRPDRFGSPRPATPREHTFDSTSRAGSTPTARSGPPWDVGVGAYVGTRTYSAHQVEQYNPGGNAALSGVSHGQIVFADGNTAMLKIGFTLVFDREDGPKLFFAKAACGGE